MENYNFKNELKSIIVDEIIVFEKKIFKINKIMKEDLKNLLFKKIFIKRYNI